MPGRDTSAIAHLELRQHVEQAVRLAKQLGFSVLQLYVVIDEFWGAAVAPGPSRGPKHSGGGE